MNDEQLFMYWNENQRVYEVHNGADVTPYAEADLLNAHKHLSLLTERRAKKLMNEWTMRMYDQLLIQARRLISPPSLSFVGDKD